MLADLVPREELPRERPVLRLREPVEVKAALLLRDLDAAGFDLADDDLGRLPALLPVLLLEDLLLVPEGRELLLRPLRPEFDAIVISSVPSFCDEKASTRGCQPSPRLAVLSRICG